MSKAHALAEELRKVADALDEHPDEEIKTANLWWMFHNEKEKDMFKKIVRLLPRPLTKRAEGTSSPTVIVEYHSDSLEIDVRIPQSATCTLVKPAIPAEYRCEPILSDEEEATLLERQ